VAGENLDAQCMRQRAAELATPRRFARCTRVAGGLGTLAGYLAEMTLAQVVRMKRQGRGPGVLTAFLGTVTPRCFGSSDFLGGLASRRSSALSITALVYAVGVVLFAVVVLVVAADAAHPRRHPVSSASAVRRHNRRAGALRPRSGRTHGVSRRSRPRCRARAAAFDLLRGFACRPRPRSSAWCSAIVAVVIVSTATHPEDEHAD